MNEYQPEKLLSVLTKAERLNHHDFSYTPEQIAQWESDCANPEKVWFLSYNKMLCVLDFFRNNPDQYKDTLISALKKRSCVSLSRSLFDYWQCYYQDVTVKKICMEYLEKRGSYVQDWEKEWKSWLSYTDPSRTMIQNRKKDIETYRQLNKKYRLKRKHLFSQRAEIFYYMLAEKDTLTLDDNELLKMTERLSQTEKTNFLIEMMKKFPIVKRNGDIGDVSRFTVDYPLTVWYLLTESRQYLEETDDILMKLLYNIMLANHIPDSEHRHFWCEEFLRTCQEDERWQFYSYQLYENAIETLCPDGYKILDFWEENILLWLPEDIILDSFFSAEQIQQSLQLSEENIITGQNWKQKIQMIVRQNKL